MAKLNISQILAMESMSFVNKEKIKKLRTKQKKNYGIAREGIFDFFRKKKDEEVKKKPLDPKEHFAELEQASKVSIHLMTTSVDAEIKYLEELISKGLPLFKKDLDRMARCFKFIIQNHGDILNNLDGLVEISYPDNGYNVSKDRGVADFNTFYVAFRNLAKDKETQTRIGSGGSYMDLEEFFEGKLSPEELSKYEMLYSLDEAVPSLDFIIPKNRAPKEQKRVYLEKGDPKLDRLIKLNMELIEKGEQIAGDSRLSDLYKLADQADSKSQPKPYGDGDESGMGNVVYQGLGYTYQITDGAIKGFIQDYTAH